MINQRLLSLITALCAVALLATTSKSLAQNNWTGNGSNANWSTPENWSSGVPADGADVFFLTGSGSGDTINTNGNRTVGELSYFNTPNATNFTIQGGVSSVLTVNTGITRNGTNSRHLTISNSNLVLATDSDGFFLNHFGTGGSLIISAPIQAAASAVITVNDFTGGSARTVSIGGNNTNFLGTWLVRRGDIGVTGNPNRALGASASNTITFQNAAGDGTNGVTLNTATNGTITWVNNFVNNNASGNGSENARIYFSGGANQTTTLTLNGSFSSGSGQNAAARLYLSANVKSGADQS